MGVTCTLYRAPENEIQRLIDDPASLGDFLDPDDGSAPRARVVRPKGLLGLVLRLFPITITEAVSEPGAPAEASVPDADRSIDLDKGWHGLHFLFTGTAEEGDEPACYLVYGGEILDDDGTTRALNPDQVRRFAEYLSGLTPADLAGRYDPQRMKRLEISPDGIWTRQAAPGESPREWLLECFSDLQRFVTRAAAAGEGLIIHIG